MTQLISVTDLRALLAPPSSYNSNQHAEYYGILMSGICGLLVNLLLFLVLLLAGQTALAMLSILGGILWSTVLFFLRKEQISLAIAVGAFEMMMHVGLIVSQIGTVYGAQLILWCAVAYCVAIDSSDRYRLNKWLASLCVLELALIYVLVPHQTQLLLFEDYISLIFIVLILSSGIPLMTVILTIKSVQIKQGKALRYHANYDGLTKLYNRGFFSSLLDYDRDTLASGGGPFCVCLADIDHFKQINDEYGHAIGDEVLVGVAKAIQQKLRQSDAVCRWGGEEFAIILRRCSSNDAPLVIENIRQSINSTVMTEHKISITMSFGLIQATQDEPTDDLLKRADVLLYKAKHAGRDRLIYDL